LEERVKRFILSIVLMAALVATALPQAKPGQLATAIQEGKSAAALEMIRAGVDVNERSPTGRVPIHWAVYRVDYDRHGCVDREKGEGGCHQRVWFERL
jgi:hypothetical protein